MKRFYVLAFLFLLLSGSLMAQLTGITPNTSMVNQTLQTTITGNGIFLQGFSPPGNLFTVKLKQGAYNITIFDFWNFVGWNTTVQNTNTVLTDFFTVPLTAPPGLYDLEVITGDVLDPSVNQTVYTLPNSFTVSPPDGYITGTVFHDLNEDGIKDAGEPGLASKVVKLLPLNYNFTTDATGNFSFPAFNGNYSVTLLHNNSDYLYLTTANDTLPVIVNSANAPGNDFGLTPALKTITPNVGFKGMTALHQLVSDKPIFVPGGSPNGNVSQFRINTISPISLNVSNTVTVIDSFTIQVLITIPAFTALQNNVDIRIFVSGAHLGYHFLRGGFNIENPPNTVSGTTFFDNNQNKVFDLGDQPVPQVQINLNPDNNLGFSSSMGAYTIGTFGGMQTATFNPATTNGLTLFTDSVSYTFNASGAITGKDFGFISSLPDYSVMVHSPFLLPRCNTPQTVSFKARNTSNIPYQMVAWLRYDPLMTFIGSSVQPYTISNDTIYWDLGIIPAYQDVPISATFMLPGFGNNITFVVGANSYNGGGVLQNAAATEKAYTILCSFDPNDKQVTPPGIFAQNYTLMSDTLEYQIRFQNTGNDTAFKVVIMDTLDMDLEIGTFELLASSHDMLTEIKSNGAITFTFNNILLPDSNVNEPGSHGYIRYRIRAKTGLPDASEVNNTAYIFFDFNPAIITNTTLNTMVYVLPVGLNENEDKMVISFYPNPMNETATLSFANESRARHTLTITDVTGKLVTAPQQSEGNQFTIDRKVLSAGLYFYRVENTVTKWNAVGKFIVK